MTKRYYIDTSIWRDYFENRSDKFRPLGEWAFIFIKKVIHNKDLILYSSLVVKELRKEYSDEQIINIFEIIKKNGLLLKVSYSNLQLQEARLLSKKRKLTIADSLHAIIARDNKTIMVTRDKHFDCLIDIVTVKKPEELI